MNNLQKELLVQLYNDKKFSHTEKSDFMGFKKKVDFHDDKENILNKYKTIARELKKIIIKFITFCASMLIF